MDEKVILNKSGVLVTDKRVVVGTNTVPILNINSVSMEKRRYLFAYVTSIVAAPVACMVGFALLVSRPNPAIMYILFFALIGAFIGGFWGADRHATYSVRISGNVGITDILKSKDQDFILLVIEAINKAIVDRL